MLTGPCPCAAHWTPGGDPGSITACNCGCVLAWRDLRPDADGRYGVAVNFKLAPREAVADLPIDHFDGLDTFEDLPSDDRCVRDMWF